VFHITASNGYCMWLYFYGYHSDRRGLYSVPKAEYGYTGYQTATHHTSPPAGI